MFIGNFNRYIRIEYPTYTKNTFGEDVETWLTLEEVYAEKFERVGRTEKIQSNQLVGVESTVFSIYFIEGINSKMRIYLVDEDKYFEIEGIKEIGYKEGLQLYCYSKDNF